MNSDLSTASEGLFRVCGGFENDEYRDSNETEIHHVLERVKVRIGFAEVWEMMNLHQIQVENE